MAWPRKDPNTILRAKIRAAMKGLPPEEIDAALRSVGNKKRKDERNKYLNIKVKVGDLEFDSKAEAECWIKLRIAEKAGKISNLQRQVKFDIEAYPVPAGVGDGDPVHICTYIADFTWTDEAGKEVVADYKTAVSRTAVYMLKRRMLKLLLGVSILEITPPRKRPQKVKLTPGRISFPGRGKTTPWS